MSAHSDVCILKAELREITSKTAVVRAGHLANID